jgi:hypothetical protein
MKTDVQKLGQNHRKVFYSRSRRLDFAVLCCLVTMLSLRAATAQSTVQTSVPLWGVNFSRGFYTYDFELNACVINGVSYVGAGNLFTSCWGSSDIGTQINAAYRAGASTGVHIHPVPGVYSFTTPITFTTASKPVFLDCAPGVDGNQSSNSATTQLRYTPMTGTAITFNNGGGSKVMGCSLAGSGKANSTVAVVMGGTNSYIYGLFDGVEIEGFGTALQFGDNAYIDMFRNSILQENTTEIYVPSGVTNMGENISFDGGTISSKSGTFSTTCINIAGQGDFHFRSNSLDQCGMTLNGTNIFADFVGDHWETTNGVTSSPFITFASSCTTCTVSLFGGVMQEDTPSVGRTEFIKNATTVGNTGIAVNIYGGTYTPAETVAQLVNSTSGCCGRVAIHGILNGIGGATFTNLVGGAWYAINTSDASVGFTTNEWFNYIERSAPSAVTSQDICYGDSSSHDLKCSYNNGSFLHMPQIIASGTSALGNGSISATTCNAAVTTTAAGATTTDAIEWTYASAPSETTDGKLILSPYLTSGNVNFVLCNPTAGALVPTGLVVNWEVIR